MLRPAAVTFTSLLLLALLAPAHVVAQEDTARTAEAAAPLVAFDWPAPATVTVTESAEKKGNKTKMRYRLAISRTDDGGLRLSYRDFEFLEVNGHDATTPAMKKALAKTVAMTAAIPDLLVDEHGMFVGATDMDEMIDRVVDSKKETRGDEASEKVRESMKSQPARDVLTAAVARYWQTWAGGWIGWSQAPGAPVTEVRTSDVFGARVEAPVTTTHHGAVDGAAGLVRLSFRVKLEGGAARKAYDQMIGALIKDEDRRREIADGFEEISMSDELEVQTDPKTLRPRVASNRKVIRLQPKGGDAVEQVESHRYEFDWGEATGDDK